MMKILIIEDEMNIREELSQLLQNALYQALSITDFNDVSRQVLSHNPDLVLLDVNLPGKDGLSVCTEIRAVSDVPVIFLTALSSSMDELNGMLKGGDDYITKPFQPPILLARIAAVLKRGQKNLPEEGLHLEHKGVLLDIAKSAVSASGNTVELTKNELQILHFLFLHREEIVSRTDLIDYLWDNQIFIDDNTLSVNITRLRNKLKEIGAEEFIHTKRGMGYRI